MLALIVAAIVVMGSPGPSTLSATAMGAAFGIRRSLPYVCGLILGTTVVLATVSCGVVALLLSVPWAGGVLTALAVLYILYLAFRIATAPPLAGDRPTVTAPALPGGLLLAMANPKAYIAVAAVLAGSPEIGPDRLQDAIAKTVVLGIMIVAIHLTWLLVGSALSRLLHHPLASRLINLTLAALLVATTAMALLRSG